MTEERKKKRIKFLLKIMKDNKGVIYKKEDEKIKNVIFKNQIYNILKDMNDIKHKEKKRYIDSSVLKDLSDEDIFNIINANKYIINIEKLRNAKDIC